MEEEIIHAVFQREEIWNPRHKNYKNVTVLQKKWTEVSTTVGKDVKTVKAKWKYLRDYFQRECKKLNHPRSGAGADDAPKGSSWQYFDAMLFIKDVSTSDKVESSLQEGSEPDRSQEGIFEDSTEHEIIQSPLPQSEESTPRSNSSCSSSRVKKQKKTQEEEILAVEKRKLDFLFKESEREEDADLLFLKSLLPDIRTLPLWRKRRLRLKIHELVVNEIEDKGQNTSVEMSFIVPPEASNQPICSLFTHQDSLP
ncbi:uncharacterized protein [Anabrus simplex]|uniref:uncharacterized protein n=1 Tax=Anabrus simplex TaxID=316456 RepID=UPI0035A3C8A1